jgi:hypothetical protein
MSEQHYFITPPTLFLPVDGMKISVIGLDEDWTDQLGDVLENALPGIPMTFYHLDESTSNQWQWQYHMSQVSNLVVVNVSKATEIDLITALNYIGDNKLWFYVDAEEVDENIIMLLNTMNANLFFTADQILSMLRAFAEQ